MNTVEAMQMARADGWSDGYAAALRDARAAIKQGTDDSSWGADLMKIADSVLAVADQRIADLAK